MVCTKSVIVCLWCPILGEYAYEFPKPFKLEKKRLKDYLEDEVDEKYYLSDKTISRISNWKAQQDPFETMNRTNETGIVPTLNRKRCRRRT